MLNISKLKKKKIILFAEKYLIANQHFSNNIEKVAKQAKAKRRSQEH